MTGLELAELAREKGITDYLVVMPTRDYGGWKIIFFKNGKQRHPIYGKTCAGAKTKAFEYLNNLKGEYYERNFIR